MSLSISISISIFSKMPLSISISILIFSRMSLSISISISIFSRMSLSISISISIFSRVTLSISISISIFSKSVDISIIDMAYRYIEHPYRGVTQGFIHAVIAIETSSWTAGKQVMKWLLHIFWHFGDQCIAFKLAKHFILDMFFESRTVSYIFTSTCDQSLFQKVNNGNWRWHCTLLIRWIQLDIVSADCSLIGRQLDSSGIPW